MGLVDSGEDYAILWLSGLFAAILIIGIFMLGYHVGTLKQMPLIQFDCKAESGE